MLAKKSRLLPLGADVLHAEWFSGDKGKAKGGPQHLSAAFACRSVNPDRAALLRRVSQDPAYPFTHTT
jgi:hypothetical protein